MNRLCTLYHSINPFKPTTLKIVSSFEDNDICLCLCLCLELLVMCHIALLLIEVVIIYPAKIAGSHVLMLVLCDLALLSSKI